MFLCGTIKISPAHTYRGKSIPMNIITLEDARKLIGEGTVTIVDVRTPEEYREAHLDRATNIDISAPDFLERIETLDKSHPYLVYCASGGRSARAVAEMEQQGFTVVYNLMGGIAGWIRGGFPVESL